MMDTPIFEVQSLVVSLAIRLSDDFTGAPPIGAVRVSLNGDKYQPILSPAGFYLFFKVKEDTYNVAITSDYYLEHRLVLSALNLDATEPIAQVTLKPNSAYPFPNGTTLIRGRVVEPDSTYALAATVKAPEKGLQNKTDGNGEFVLYFKPLTEDEVAIEVDATTKETIRYVKTAAGKHLSINASKDSYAGDLMVDLVSEGISNNVKYIQLK